MWRFPTPGIASVLNRSLGKYLPKGKKCYLLIVSDTPRIRSEIFETNNPWIKSARITIHAPSKKIFDILANPYRHQDLDGSATIRNALSGPNRLQLDSKFSMAMRLGINYRVTNTVVEFRENEIIAWRHLGRWRWRYELTAISADETLVTETLDASKAPQISKWWLTLRKAMPWTQMAVAKTLVNLKVLAEGK